MVPTCLVSVGAVLFLVMFPSTESSDVGLLRAPAIQGTATLSRLFIATKKSCDSEGKDIWTCLGQRAEGWAERALKMRSLPIAEGVSLVRTSTGDARAVQKGDALYNLLEDFSLQITPPALLTDPTLLKNAVEKGRGKLKKYLKPLILIASAIKTYLFVGAVKTLAALAAKALFIGKLALLLALFAAYRNNSPKKEIEVIKIPKVTHSHNSYHHHHAHDEGEQYHHQQEHKYSHGWESSYGGEEGGSSGGGGDYYDWKRSDRDHLNGKVSDASVQPYRGYYQEKEPGFWSKKDDGADWIGEEGTGDMGREERSATWKAVAGRAGEVLSYYEPSSGNGK